MNEDPPRVPARSRTLTYYFILTYVFVLGNTAGYFRSIESHTGLVLLYAVGVYLTYSLLYLAPAIAAVKGLDWIWRFFIRRGSGTEACPVLINGVLYGLAIGGGALVQLFLYGDRKVFEIYGMHFNGFVWNLITTRGGLESLGGTSSTSMTLTGLGLAFLIWQALLLWATHAIPWLQRFCAALMAKRSRIVLVFLFLVLALGERAIYGISSLKSEPAVLLASNVFPFYRPVTFRRLGGLLGLKIHRGEEIKVHSRSGTLVYPAKELEIIPPARPMNIVWLVSESLRADMLDPEIMPALWKFSRGAHRFAQHYSGGNGTRMGMFSMFYGLYGPYWFPFLAERRGPVILDVLQKENYQLEMFTSAAFSYPEFDQTIFSQVPSRSLHELHEGFGWERDRRNVQDLLHSLEQRDRTRPFMSFMFFESPHAHYYFPPESVIRRPYLEDLNYATMDLQRDITLIKNRYINSCHHLDSQLHLIFAYLEREHLLDTSIVLVTGDHGEEFLEKGRWGHNSDFTEEQTRVPLVLWIPGTGSSEIARLTSHLDIAPTLLPILGVTNSAADYSFGFDLFHSQERPYTVVCDWARVAVIDHDYKVSFPVGRDAPAPPKVTRKNDEPLNDPKPFYQSHQDQLHLVLTQLSQFTRRAKSRRPQPRAPQMPASRREP